MIGLLVFKISFTFLFPNHVSKPKIIKIYSNTPNALKNTNQKLNDTSTNVSIETYSDCAERLVKNDKLIAYSLFQGKYKDTNETFTLRCRSSIYPATSEEIDGDTQMKWSIIFDIISLEHNDKILIDLLAVNEFIAFMILDWMTLYGLCHQCRNKVCVYTKFEDLLNELKNTEKPLSRISDMKYYEKNNLPI